jgi:hypothetical protein
MLKTAAALTADRPNSTDRLRQASRQDRSAPEKAPIPVTGGRMAKECKEQDSSLQLTSFEMTGPLLNSGNPTRQMKFCSQRFKESKLFPASKRFPRPLQIRSV